MTGRESHQKAAFLLRRRHPGADARSPDGFHGRTFGLGVKSGTHNQRDKNAARQHDDTVNPDHVFGPYGLCLMPPYR